MWDLLLRWCLFFAFLEGVSSLSIFKTSLRHKFHNLSNMTGCVYVLETLVKRYKSYFKFSVESCYSLNENTNLFVKMLNVTIEKKKKKRTSLGKLLWLEAIKHFVCCCCCCFFKGSTMKSIDNCSMTTGHQVIYFLLKQQMEQVTFVLRVSSVNAESVDCGIYLS